jgi:hypothetical protein
VSPRTPLAERDRGGILEAHPRAAASLKSADFGFESSQCRWPRADPPCPTRNCNPPSDTEVAAHEVTHVGADVESGSRLTLVSVMADVKDTLS